ncbi:MAG: diacylglycerol kinase family protein [Candidatus Limnocylindria bacterium]
MLRSFRFALAGMRHFLLTQRNARIELAAGAAALALAAWLGLGPVEWAVLVLTIALVLILEGLNTTVERAVDLASPGWSAEANVAKDVAAAMVLVAALASVAVGLLLFGPPLWQRFVGP